MAAHIRTRTLLRQLGNRVTVTRVRRGFVSFWLAECSEADISSLEGLALETLDRLKRAVEAQLEVGASRARLDIVCLGESRTLDGLPEPLRSIPYLLDGCGVWAPRFGVGVVPMRNKGRVLEIVVHEIVHGLLYVLSEGFEYPPALEEGFARIAERLLTEGQPASGESQGRSWEDPRDRFPSSELKTVKGLLTFRRSASPRYQPSDYQAAVMGTWLHVFLTRLGRDHEPLRHVLGAIRTRRLVTGAEVQRWIEDATSMSSEELERRFADFCAGH